MAFWPFKKRNAAPVNEETLADFTRGMQHAVNATQETCELHYARMFERYFEEDGSAKTRDFILPNGKKLTVPLVAVIPPNGMLLKEAVVKMSVRIERTATKQMGDDAPHLSRTSFSCSFAKRGTEGDASMVDVELRFAAGDPPEGVARLLEQYVNGFKEKEKGG